MFGGLFKDIKDTISTVRHGAPTRTITVAKPYCCPARNIIEPVLAKYGVKIYHYSEGAKLANPLATLIQGSKIPDDAGLRVPMALPVAQVAEVTVSEAAAAWAEYLLLRTGKLYVPGRYVNKRNQQWAAKHGGQMPPAWNEGKPWIESSCSDGIRQWQQVKDAIKKGKGEK